MDLILADNSHNQKLVNFYKSYSQNGPVEYKVDRCSDFFRPYEIQSEHYMTYLLMDKNQVEGTASFVIREVLLDGRPTRIAVGRDLRVSSNRQAVLNWSKHFLPVTEEVCRKYDCEHVFTSLSMAELQALNAFVRPRQMRRVLPRYYLFRRFNLVSVHGRFPWARNPLPHLKVMNAEPRHYDAILAYLIDKSYRREMATVWDSLSFERKLKRWKGLSLKNFILAIDKNDNILGCVAPWSSRGIEELIPVNYNLRSNNFRQFLKLGRLFGLARPITKPSVRLSREECFNFKYLCFLFAENEDVFESMLWFAYEQAKDNEFLLYTQMRSELKYRRPFNWMTAKMPHTVYYLQNPEKMPPSFLSPYNENHCEMEPFFV